MFEMDRRSSTSPAPQPILARSDRAGGWLFWLSAFGALLWFAGASALGSLLLQSISTRTLPLWAVIAAVAFAILPAILLLVSGAAAREGARARADAKRLADAAERMLSPSPVAELAARRLGTSVRGEIAALDRCVEQAIARFHGLDEAVSAQLHTIGLATEAAYDGSGALSQHLEEQQRSLANIGRSLAEQARSIGDAISRHQGAVVAASKAAERDMQQADEALESRLTSFAAAASLIADRTEALESAAKSSAEAALRLESVLSRSLEALTKVTGITDAARHSAEQAVEAAEQTARSLRDATREAIEEARRAGESLSHGTVATAGASLGESLSGTAAARRPAEETVRREAVGAGRGLWRHMLAAIDEERIRARESKDAPVAEITTPPEPQDLGIAGRLLLERAGLRVEGLFSVPALERIGQASRRGPSARRRCVRDVAPDAVLHYQQRLGVDVELRRKTEQLLSRNGERMNEMLARGRAPLSADATRIFLLIDAAHE